MSDEIFDRGAILDNLLKILDIQEHIVAAIDSRICCPANLDESDWESKREAAGKYMKSLMPRFFFSKHLPADELGIAAQSVISLLLKIQHSLAEVIVMIDMVREETFNEIYMDSLTTISKKVCQEFAALKNLFEATRDSSESASDFLDAILRLERSIDEDNIIICRQISVVTGEGESGFVCYMMRRIVRELEHISDFIKETAEIISDF